MIPRRQPVADLRPDGVVVLDHGQPQPLLALEYVDLRQVDGPAQPRDFVLAIDDLHIHPARTQATIAAAVAFVGALSPHIGSPSCAPRRPAARCVLDRSRRPRVPSSAPSAANSFSSAWGATRERAFPPAPRAGHRWLKDTDV